MGKSVIYGWVNVWFTYIFAYYCIQSTIFPYSYSILIFLSYSIRYFIFQSFEMIFFIVIRPNCVNYILSFYSSSVSSEISLINCPSLTKSLYLSATLLLLTDSLMFLSSLMSNLSSNLGFEKEIIFSVILKAY